MLYTFPAGVSVYDSATGIGISGAAVSADFYVVDYIAPDRVGPVLTDANGNASLNPGFQWSRWDNLVVTAPGYYEFAATPADVAVAVPLMPLPPRPPLPPPPPPVQPPPSPPPGPGPRKEVYRPSDGPPLLLVGAVGAGVALFLLGE